MKREEQGREARRENKTDIVGLASFGFFLVVVGAVFASTPNLATQIGEMIGSIRLKEVSPNIFFPTLESDFPVVYGAVLQVCIAMLAVSAVLLAVRYIIKQPIRWKAEGVGNVVFWAGAAWVASMIVAGSLNSVMALGYFIASVGSSMIVNNIIVIAYWRLRSG